MELKPCPTFDLKHIEENLPKIEVNENIIINDSASDVTDDLDNDLHNTIIENPSSVLNEISTDKSSTFVHNVDIEEVTEEVKEVVNEEVNDGSHEKNTILDQNLLSDTPNQTIQTNDDTAINTRTIEQILNEAKKNAPQPKNATKIIRQNVVFESRKSILPIAKKPTRATTYKRRSSTYEPRKIDARKSLGVLKQVASKVTKTISDKKEKGTNIINVNVSSKLPLKSQTFQNNTESAIAKKRLTIVNQPLRVPIVSTRQSTSTTVRAQLRETKNSLTSLAVSKAASRHVASLNETSATSQHAKFLKPSIMPVKKPAVLTSSSTTSKSNNSGKCQYCDKFFAKSHGMITHLLEKCEKIPASARRQLSQSDKKSDEANSKQVSRRKTQANHHNDFISKYSRFFENLTNEGASGVSSAQSKDGIAAIDVEKGLKNLRSELRKISGAYTGIIRTPKKLIRCHICEKQFLDCVEYADHSTKHLHE